MHGLSIPLVLVASGAMALLLWQRKPSWVISIFLGTLVLQGVLGGLSWKWVPFYGLGLLAVGLAVWFGLPRWGIIASLVGLLGGVGLSLGLAYVLPDFAFPQPAGSHPVSTATHRWSSGLEAQIWYPAMPDEGDALYRYLDGYSQPLFNLPPFIYGHLQGRETAVYFEAEPAGGSFPIIVYAHGADGFAQENTFLLSELASHGYVVVAVVHQNRLADYDLDLATLSAQPEAFLDAMRDVVMADRGAELAQFVAELATLNSANGPLSGTLDLTQLHFVGYSLGGAIVTDYCATHAGCQSVTNLDGNPFVSAPATGLNTPYLHISQQAVFAMAATEEPTSPTRRMAQAYTTEVEQIVSRTTGNGAPAIWLQLQASGHGSFTDLATWIQPRWGVLQLMVGTVDPTAAQQTVQQVLLEYLHQPLAFTMDDVRANGGTLLSPFVVE